MRHSLPYRLRMIHLRSLLLKEMKGIETLILGGHSSATTECSLLLKEMKGIETDLGLFGSKVVLQRSLLLKEMKGIETQLFSLTILSTSFLFPAPEGDERD